MCLDGPESHARGLSPRLHPVYPGLCWEAVSGPYREIIYALIGVSRR
jgi:hypothetical protein